MDKIRQIWYTAKYAIESFIEWQDAKDWAKEFHPAWVEIATRARTEDTRTIYRNKILRAYRGYMNE